MKNINTFLSLLLSVASVALLFQSCQVGAEDVRNVSLDELIKFSGKTVETIQKRGNKGSQLKILNGTPSEIKRITDGFIDDLKKLKYVYAMPTDSRQAKWNTEPTLKRLDEDLKKVKESMLMNESKLIDTYEKNDNLLHLIAELSLIGKDQSYAPTLKKAEEELGKYQDQRDENIKYTAKCGLKRKYLRKDGAIRLLFSKVIAPNQVAPSELATESSTVSFHDEKGRLCRCTC